MDCPICNVSGHHTDAERARCDAIIAENTRHDDAETLNQWMRSIHDQLTEITSLLQELCAQGRER